MKKIEKYYQCYPRLQYPSTLPAKNYANPKVTFYSSPQTDLPWDSTFNWQQVFAMSSRNLQQLMRVILFLNPLFRLCNLGVGLYVGIDVFASCLCYKLQYWPSDLKSRYLIAQTPSILILLCRRSETIQKEEIPRKVFITPSKSVTALCLLINTQSLVINLFFLPPYCKEAFFSNFMDIDRNRRQSYGKWALQTELTKRTVNVVFWMLGSEKQTTTSMGWEGGRFVVFLMMDAR